MSCCRGSPAALPPAALPRAAAVITLEEKPGAIRVRHYALLLLLAVAPVLAQRREPERLLRPNARGTHAAIAGGTGYATEAGMRLLHAGGNAVDAGVGAMFTAAVTEYSHFGMGGEAPILIRTKDGRVVSIAGVGTMPKRATAGYFRQRRLSPGETYMIEPQGLKYMVPTSGVMAALVPGMVDAALLALKEFGSMPFGQVAESAIERADATPLDEERAMTIRATRTVIALWPTSTRVFLPEGRLPRAGDLFRQPDLARTLRAMANAEKKALAGGASRAQAIDAVRDFFYRGDIAHRIAAFVESQGGLLRYEDMAAFRLEVEPPVSAVYHGYRVYKPGFWSQGPVMLETLNLLGDRIASLGHNSPDYIHTMVEALKLAYADRDAFYGDPKFVKAPAERLLSPEYAAERRALIGPAASLAFRPGAIEGFNGRHPSVESTPRPANLTQDTTCLVVADASGIVFASTPSGAWLPSVIAGDTGIPLTQRAQSFLLMPGHPNELAPGKRPRVTLSPTLITRDGAPALAIATPGGDNQEQVQVQVMLNVLEFGMTAQRAVEAPRVQTRHLVSSFDNHGMAPGELDLDERIEPRTARQLAERGHRVETRSRWASEAAPVVIRILPNGVIEAGADPYAYRSAKAW